MNGKLLKLIAVFLYLPVNLIAQDNLLEIRRENEMESVQTISDDFPENISVAPYDINDISFGDLLSIPHVSPEFAQSIVNYRKKVSEIDSIDKLAFLKGATDKAIASLKSSCFVKTHRLSSFEYSNYAGYCPTVENSYMKAYGDPGIKAFQKFRGVYNGVNFFLISDKDAGEKNYFDFYSGSVMVSNFIGFSRVVVGDFLINFGNGLLFSAPLRYSKGSDPINSIFNRDREVVDSYRSRAEFGMMRGISAVYSLNSFDFITFASKNGLDATIDSAGLVTSINYSGLHQGADFRKHNLNETVAGVGIKFTYESIDLGILAAHFDYSHSFKSTYWQNGLATSAFIKIFKENFYGESEFVFQRGASYAINLKLDYDAAAFTIGFRNLRMALLPTHSNPMSEAYPLLPENGIYLGAKLRPVDEMEMGFYYDRFSFKPLSSSIIRNGEEIFFDCTGSLPQAIGGGLIVYFRYRYKSAENFYLPQYDGYPVTQSVALSSRQNFRLEFRKRFNNRFRIKAKYERNILGTGETGELLAFHFLAEFGILTISPGLAVCRTGSYDTAFYILEQDVGNSSPFVLLYGDEFRLSLLISAQPVRNCKIMFKFGRDSFASGRKLTIGNVSSIVSNTMQISAGIACLFGGKF
ncbi:MAG: ComEA family DNA-binding protein [Candidatus Kryptoniota bacterium]